MKAALLFLLPVCALGRVGEPYAEFKARVEVKPAAERAFRSGAVEAEFKVGAINVRLLVFRGVIQAEEYWDVTDTQAAEILVKQGEWRKIRAVGIPEWAGKDGTRAELALTTLRITTPEAEKIRELIKSERAGDKAKEVEKF